MTAYDTTPYMSQAYPETHVDRLFTLAQLFHLPSAPVDNCRVLEIACADGANLVPMAEALPNSTFVGVDLSEQQVLAGQERSAPLGLSNLTLMHGSFVDLDEEPFDYVIAHGLVSWISPDLRAPLLACISEHLAPEGVAYVSYNTLPGFSRKAALRDFLRMHTDGIADPAQRAERARQMMRWLLAASSRETDHGRLCRTTAERMLGAPTPYLLHGLLAEHNHPLYFRDFLAEAGNAGLAYLSDADFGSMLPERLYPEARLGMESAPGGLEEHEQIHDFLVDRSFRRTLLVHRDRAPVRSIPWERAESLYISGQTQLTQGTPEDDQEARFDTHGIVYSTDDPVLKHAMSILMDTWPRVLHFSEWVSLTSERSRCGGPVTRTTLGRNLLALYGRGIVDLGPRSLGAASAVHDCPKVTRSNRRRMELGLPVIDLRHQVRNLPRIPAHLGAHLDGSLGTRGLLKVLKNGRRLKQITFDGTPERALEQALLGMHVRSLLVE